MNKRTVLIILTWALCLGTGWAVLFQRRELIRLRAQQEQAPARAVAAQTEMHDDKASVNADALSEADSRELLRLRGEVTRLNARKHELAEVAEANERLRAELEKGSTNAVTNRLPPGYLRKADAQFTGYSTPEDTVQSLLWALAHHDVNRLLQSFSPEMKQKIEAGGPESFFKNADALPGVLIRGRTNLTDGSAQLEIEIGPSVPGDKLHLTPVDGEWKFDSLF